MASSDLDQARFDLALQGYTLLPGVLSPAQVQELRTQTLALAERIGTESTFGGPARHVANLIPCGEAFLALADHPQVLPVVEAVLGTHIILASLNARIVRPGDRAQDLHSDVPDCLRRAGPPVMVNTVWLLDAFTADLGGTRLVPGSHQLPENSPPPGRRLPTCGIEAPAGSVLVFDGRTWHGGGANQTTHARVALFGHYRVADWTLFQCDPHHGFDPARLRRLSARQRALLRMQQGVRGPTWAEDAAV